MENPCHRCVVQANCTEVCPVKNNNNTLLRNAINQAMIGAGHKRKINPKYLEHYQRYQGLFNQCLTDIASIQLRAREAKGDTMNMGQTRSKPAPK